MKSSQILDELRLILLSAWDPVGVGDNPNLADEYDRYLPTLFTLLKRGAGKAEITAALQKIERDDFGACDSSGAERAATEIADRLSIK